MTSRALAFELLSKAEKSKQYSNITLDNALKNSDMSEADKRLVSALFYGVTEKKITLDYRIAKLSSRPIEQLDSSVLTALRMGIYQLVYLDRIPPHAAINETVSLCSKKTAGYVNAILRAHTRDPKMELPPKSDFPHYLSVAYSVCLPLAQKLIDCFGNDNAEHILSGFDITPDTTLRTNTLKISREELLSKIEGALPTENAPAGIHTKGSVRQLFGFNDGLFFVQDEASQICVEVLDTKEGHTVLDICSCPGSKSFGAAINMKNKGRLQSFDLHANKLSLVISGGERLGINIIETQECDGRKFIPELEGKADRVLCDVPCSGFGVLAKKPELRYKDPKESEALPKIQADILENACKYVKKGGILVYSTCTLLPEENEKNIERFLKGHPEFSLCPWQVGGISAPSGMLTLYPHVHKTDGFFIAKLIRKQL